MDDISVDGFLRTHPRGSHLGVVGWVQVGLEAFLSLSALGGALGLITGALDLEEVTQELPLASPVLGGLALALIVAVPAAVAAALELDGDARAPTAHVAVGALLMSWVALQVAFIGLTSPLQPIMATYGLVLLVIAVGARSRGQGIRKG